MNKYIYIYITGHRCVTLSAYNRMNLNFNSRGPVKTSLTVGMFTYQFIGLLVLNVIDTYPYGSLDIYVVLAIIVYTSYGRHRTTCTDNVHYNVDN